MGRPATSKTDPWADAAMNCLDCRGACCEEIHIRTEDLQLPGISAWEWLTTRGEVVGGSIRFESRCPELTECGACSLHDTPGKPKVCRDLEVGGADCLDYIRRRRDNRAPWLSAEEQRPMDRRKQPNAG